MLNPQAHVGWKGGLSATGISILWGGNIVAIKIALQAIEPLMMAGLTFLLGGLSILLWTRFHRISLRTEGREIIDHLINGLLFTLQVSLFYIGADLTSASHAVILTNTNIFFVALLSHYFIQGDRLTALKTGGLLLAFGGIAYLFLDQPSLTGQASLTGNFIVLASAILLGIRIIHIKKLVERIDPSKLVLWQTMIGVPFFFGLAYLFHELKVSEPSFAVLMALLYQGVIVAGFTFVASTLLLKRYAPTALSSFFFTVPVAGVFLSYSILGEALTPHILTSTLLVALGIWLVHVKTRVIVD